MTFNWVSLSLIYFFKIYPFGSVWSLCWYCFEEMWERHVGERERIDNHLLFLSSHPRGLENVHIQKSKKKCYQILRHKKTASVSPFLPEWNSWSRKSHSSCCSCKLHECLRVAKWHNLGWRNLEITLDFLVHSRSCRDFFVSSCFSAVSIFGNSLSSSVAFWASFVVEFDILVLSFNVHNSQRLNTKEIE